MIWNDLLRAEWQAALESTAQQRPLINAIVDRGTEGLQHRMRMHEQYQAGYLRAIIFTIHRGGTVDLDELATMPKEKLIPTLKRLDHDTRKKNNETWTEIREENPDGWLSCREFAEREGLTKVEVRALARAGRITNASTTERQWWFKQSSKILPEKEC